MKKVVIVVNRLKNNAEKLLNEITPLIEEHMEIISVDLDMSLDLSSIKSDFVFVQGGDGTILSAARRLKGNQITVFGINLGHLGFLAQTTPESFRNDIVKINSGDYDTVSRMMMEVSVRGNSPGKDPLSYLSLNDVVITNRDESKYTVVDASINSQYVTRYKGDGLIVSTPTGSTGHSLSAGGPIVERSMNAFIVTPICAPTLTVRPLVVSGDSEITLNITKESGSSVFIVDGDLMSTFETEALIRIKRFDKPFRMLYTEKTSEFRLLNEKLGWGGSL